MLLLMPTRVWNPPAHSIETWPCAFKRLWFHDMPFLLTPEAEAGLLTIARTSSHKFHVFVKGDLLDGMVSSFGMRIAIQMRRLNRQLLRSIVVLSNSPFNCRQKMRGTILSARLKRASPASLSSLPVELRLKIFEYVTQGASMNVVGYRKGEQDSFYFKQRGDCPVAMICKQFHEEALEAYFRNLLVTIKSATPSQFSGDMSSFGAAIFRSRLKRITITDWDEARRSKICSAFVNAQIEYGNKHALGSRKGAYYFN